jgi:hypothetical protein
LIVEMTLSQQICPLYDIFDGVAQVVRQRAKFENGFAGYFLRFRFHDDATAPE